MPRSTPGTGSRPSTLLSSPRGLIAGRRRHGHGHPAASSLRVRGRRAPFSQRTQRSLEGSPGIDESSSLPVGRARSLGSTPGSHKMRFPPGSAHRAERRSWGRAQGHAPLPVIGRRGGLGEIGCAEPTASSSDRLPGRSGSSSDGRHPAAIRTSLPYAMFSCRRPRASAVVPLPGSAAVRRSSGSSGALRRPFGGAYRSSGPLPRPLLVSLLNPVGPVRRRSSEEQSLVMA